MPTDTKNPEQRFRPEAMLAKAQADLADAKQAHAQAAFRHAQGDDPAALAEVEALEREVDQHAKTVARLQAAMTVASHVDSQAEREAAEALELQRLADVETLAREIESTSTQVVSVLDQLSPLLAQLDNLCAKRSGIAWSVLRNRLSDKRLEGMQNRMGQAQPASVVLSGIKASGLGRIGPRLEPYLVVSSTPMPLPEEAIADLRARHALEHHALLEATGRLPKAEPVNTIATTEEATHE